MWNSDALTFPESSSPEAKYTLSREIAGMQLISAGDGTARIGPISRLPKGAEIEAFGEGINERTLKVRYAGCFYLVFCTDVDMHPEMTLRD